MPNKYHKDLRDENIHEVTSKSYPGIAERDSDTQYLVQENVNKIVKTSIPSSMYALMDANQVSVTDDAGSALFTSSGDISIRVGTNVVHSGFTEPGYNGNFVVTDLISLTEYKVGIGYISDDSGFYSEWLNLGSTDVNTLAKILANGNTTDGSDLIISIGDNLLVSDHITVGAITPPNADASIDLKGTNKAFLLNRITQTVRDTLNEEGLIAYISDLSVPQYRNGAGWNNLGGGDVSGPATSIIGEIVSFSSADGKNITGSSGATAADVVLNSAHRVSDGKDHSDVVLNNSHRLGDGSDHADVALNTTHRTSSGTDHSDVVLNSAHRTGDGSDHSGVALNTTHRTSDGKDHSDVVLNNTHRLGDGSDHADVALNTTHRGSDGKDHADVVLNNAHRVSDGKDHSDVLLNNAHRISDGKDHSDVVLNNAHRVSDGKDHSDVVLNNAHRVSDGSDHTFIDQAVTISSSPTFSSLTLADSNVVFVKSISDFPTPSAGNIILAANTTYIGDNQKTTITFTDNIIFSQNSRIIDMKISTDSKIDTTATENFEFRDCYITYTGNSTLFDMLSVGGFCTLLRNVIVLTGIGTLFNINSVTANTSLILEKLSIAGNSNVNLGNINDVITLVDTVKISIFNSGLTFNDNAAIDIGTIETTGANASTTHLSFDGTTQGRIQIVGFAPIVQSNEYAINFDPTTTFSDTVTVIGSTPSDGDRVFEIGSFDQSTVGFKFSGNTNIPDSTANADIGALDQAAVQTLLDQLQIKRINATFTEIGSERFSTTSSGTVEYLGLEDITASVIHTITGTVSTGTGIPVNFYIVKGNSTNTITAFANAGGGQVTVTASAPHGFSNGDDIVIEGTANYDYSYSITNVTATTYEITATFVVTETGTHGKVQLGTKAGNDFSGSNSNTTLVAHIPIVTNDFMYLAVENTGNNGEWETEDIHEIYSKV